MNSKALIIVLLLAIIVGAGALYASSQNRSALAPTVSPTPTAESNTQVPTTSPAMSPTSSPQTGSSPTTSTMSTKTFTIAASNYTYDTKELRVKKGDTVTITLNNAEGMHDVVIDEFDVRTPVIDAGKQATITFVADKAGQFEYYCSVGQHRQMGMKGMLIVE